MPGQLASSGNNGLVVSSAPPLPTKTSPRPSITPQRPSSASDPVKPSLTSLTVTSNLKVVNDLKSPSEAVILETKPVEEPIRPKRISFCKPEAANSPIKTPVKPLPVKEVDVATSPSSPCSQCLREEHKKAAEISPSGHNGGQEFFGSSEECCSSWSGESEAPEAFGSYPYAPQNTDYAQQFVYDNDIPAPMQVYKPMTATNLDYI